MKAVSNLSIRNKLVGIVLISTTLSVVGGFALVIYENIRSFREDLENNTATIAKIVGYYVGYFAEFENKEEAKKEIDKVSRLSWISDAYFFDLEGELYCFYSRNGVSPPTTIPDKDGCGFDEGDFIYCSTQVFYTDPDPELAENKHVGTFYLRASTESYNEDVRGLIVFMGVVMVTALGAAAILAYVLQGFISKPVLHLAAMAKHISDEADYSVRVRKPGNDEIGVLYDGFNNMLEQIQRRQEDLERSNRDLDQFAYVASHDLKAPLRAISTLSGWIEEDMREKLTTESSEQMRLLRSRVKRMDQLIDGILQYSRAGRLDTHGEKIDVGEMLRDLVELLSPPEDFRITIGEMPVMTTRRSRLEQVFSNLITNAIKYHDRQDGRVEVTARRLGRFFEFSVKDDGPGIAKEHHEKIFMMFQTLQPRDQVESTGLGLSLVKKLVEEEGGSIQLESEPGQGADFRFIWPIDGGESSEDVQS